MVQQTRRRGAILPAQEMVIDLPYDRWRTTHPEDSLRFYGLRLHEVGQLRNNARTLIAQGSDWRYFNELRKELKA